MVCARDVQKNISKRSFNWSKSFWKPTDNEHQYYPVDDFDSVWTISEPGGVETLSFTGNGFLGFYVGGTHSYQILSRNSNTMYLKTIGWDDLSWFIIITNEQ